MPGVEDMEDFMLEAVPSEPQPTDAPTIPCMAKSKHATTQRYGGRRRLREIRDVRDVFMRLGDYFTSNHWRIPSASMFSCLLRPSRGYFPARSPDLSRPFQQNLPCTV